MKRAISLILVLAMCLSLCACGGNKKAFEASQAAYNQIQAAYEITSQFGEDIYDVWETYVNNKKELTSDGVAYLMEKKYMHLTEEELREGIAYAFVSFAHTEEWDEVPEEKRQEYHDNADVVLKVMSDYDYFMSFCIDCITYAYQQSGKTETAQAALDEAKIMMKDLSEKYSDYEHYPNLKGFYTATKSYFDFCKDPSGSFEQYTTTMNDYKNKIRGYISDLDYIFED